MAENRTDNTPYESLYGGGWLTPNQFLAESMCARKARSKGQTLPPKFWEVNETWKREFLLQIRHVSGLLRLYSAESIIKALRTPGGRKVYSFVAKWLDPLIAEQQRIIELQQANVAIVKDVEPQVIVGKTGPRPVFKKGTTTSLDKLRALDGEEEVR